MIQIIFDLSLNKTTYELLPAFLFESEIKIHPGNGLEVPEDLSVFGINPITKRCIISTSNFISLAPL